MADDFTMSSAELLDLLAEFPEDSELVKASGRTYRVVEVPAGEERKIVLLSAIRLDEYGLFEAVELPDDAILIDEFVDWTHDRKIAARNAREIAIMRCERRGADYDPDMSGLNEPLRAILDSIELKKKRENISGAKSLIRGGLFKMKGGEHN